MYDIVIGRSEEDKKKFGLKGTVMIGKQYVQMGRTTSLSNHIYLDVANSHVIFVCGKRGSGKSYSLAVIAEGVANLPEEIRQNISIIMLDTMGIYWSMKYPNVRDKDILDEWDLEAKGLDVQIFTPSGYFKEYKDKGIPTDIPFSILPSELNSSDWTRTFEIEENSDVGVLIQRVIHELKEKKESFGMDDIIKAVDSDSRSSQNMKDGANNHFLTAKEWGLFEDKGTKISDLVIGGKVTILDLSCYATMDGGWNIKSLVVGLISQKLFIERMIARKNEEFEELKASIEYFSEDKKQKQEFPLVWLAIDEAHEFLPVIGKTLATDPLVTILREGRQPGISLLLASQQPGKIHTDVMTQSDTILSHRITAKLDTDALGLLMQSYMREGLDKMLNELPRVKGAALILDDNNERLFQMKVMPRISWHGGSSPTALREEKEYFK